MDEKEKQKEATNIIVKAIALEACRRNTGSLTRDLYGVLMDVSRAIGEHMDDAEKEGGD